MPQAFAYTLWHAACFAVRIDFFNYGTESKMAMQPSDAKRSRTHKLRRASGRLIEPVSANMPSQQAPTSADAAKRRQDPAVVNRLLSSTIDWLASLPPNVRPLALATKFPRVANRIAGEWREPNACRRDFDDLVYDKRGTRRGFPPDVYVELLALRDYYYGYDLKFANEA
jgi:hypothetical protein